MPVQDALWRADDSKLSVEQLTALSRAVPEDQERRDLALFLKVIRAFVQLAALSASHYDEVPIQGRSCSRLSRLSRHLAG